MQCNIICGCENVQRDLTLIFRWLVRHCLQSQRDKVLFSGGMYPHKTFLLLRHFECSRQPPSKAYIEMSVIQNGLQLLNSSHKSQGKWTFSNPQYMWTIILLSQSFMVASWQDMVKIFIFSVLFMYACSCRQKVNYMTYNYNILVCTTHRQSSDASRASMWLWKCMWYDKGFFVLYRSWVSFI